MDDRNPMYSCRQVHDHASRLVDGELTVRQTIALRVHLALCRSCRRFVRQFRLLSRLLRRDGQATQIPPVDVEKCLAEIPFDDPETVRAPTRDRP